MIFHSRYIFPFTFSYFKLIFISLGLIQRSYCILYLSFCYSEDSYLVIDHCQKNLIQITEEDDIVNNSSRYLIKLAMLKNHEGKLVEMVSIDEI